MYLLPEMATYLCKAWGDPRGSWEARTQSTNEFVLVEKQDSAGQVRDVGGKVRW